MLLAACSSSSPSTTAHTAAPVAGHYAILANPLASADGVTAQIVRVVGTNPDGSPSTEDVVLGMSRPGAGHFTGARLKLGGVGAQTAFVACDQASTGCLGPLTLYVALASAPTTPIAHVDIANVDPALLDVAKQCRGGGNALYLNGNDQIFAGEETIDATATWANNAFPELVTIDVTTATETWKLQFNTARVPAINMFPGPYLGATLADNAVISNQPVGYPAMNVSGNGHACSAITGSFQILDYHFDNYKAATTIVFDQHCEGSTTTHLRGCMHVEP